MIKTKPIQILGFTIELEITPRELPFIGRFFQ